MSLTAGSRLGPYEIVAMLGAGGMGEVYRAVDSRLGRDVAVKVLSSAFSADPDRLQRFEQEARSAAALNHPNILAVHDIGTDSGAPFIVSELLDGQTLREALGGGALAMRRAIGYAIQIASGLAAAHEKGIVHRDVKPENVFITTDGRVKILDFGLAKLIEPAPSPMTAGVTLMATRPANTGAGVVLGTMGYMSPEQLRGRVVDHRTDLFSFGALLYELLSGEGAFLAETPADTISAILSREPVELAIAHSHIPSDLARIVHRCLEKDAARRFQSARDLAFALENVSPTSARVEPVAGRKGGRLGPLVSAAVLGAIVLGGLIARWPSLRSDGSSDQPVGRFTIDVDEVTTPQGPAGFVSPDGRFLVVRRAASGGMTLQLRALDDVGLRPVPTGGPAGQAFWSPDSRSIGFFSAGQLKRWDVGAPAAAAVAPIAVRAGGGFSGSWGDKTILVSEGTGALLAVPVGGGELKPATRLNGVLHETSHRWPVFLPDGQHFLFTAYTSEQLLTTAALTSDVGSAVYWASLESNPVRVGELRGRVSYSSGYILFEDRRQLMAQAFDPQRGMLKGDPRPLLSEVAGDWSVTASVLVFGNRNLREQRLTWRGRDGRDLGAIGPSGSYPTFSLSRDGRRVVAENRVGDAQNLWVIDAERGATSRLTVSEFHDVDPRWSPDGREVIFGSTRSKSRSPFRVRLADPQPQQVFEFDGRSVALDDWSPDGRFLLFHETGLPILYAQFIDPVAARVIAARALTGMIDQAQMSPDSRLVAFNTNESGRAEVVLVPFPPTGDRWPVTNDGGVQAKWRADGRELYFLSPAGDVMAVDVTAAAGSVRLGTPHTLFSSGVGEPSMSVEQYAPAPDGQRFLVAAAVPGNSPGVTVITNWQTLLKPARADRP